MAQPAVPFDPEALLAQVHWVRALARRIAQDPDSAEDLAQDALTVALRRRPRIRAEGGGSDTKPGGREAARGLRRWLAAVVRNQNRTRRMADRRRAVREAVASSNESVRPTDELVECAAVQRDLVGALLRLEEPYRTTLLLRFFEECTQREIAERCGVPVSTVGSRIAIGIERLRRSLGAREDWLPSLLVFARNPGGGSGRGVSTGVVLMSSQVKILFAASVLLASLLALGRFEVRSVEGEIGPQTEASIEVVRAPAADPQRAVVVSTAPAAVVVQESGSRDFFDIPAHAGLVFVRARGRVVELDGRPVGGVAVRRRGPSLGGARALGPAIVSDAEGRFEVAGMPALLLFVEDESYTTLFEGMVERDTEDEVQVVVAPRIELGGSVVDDAGLPIAGATLTVRPVVSAGADLGHARLSIPEVVTAQDGRFQFPAGVCAVPLQLFASAPGFPPRILELPPVGDLGLTVTLTRAARGPFVIRGRVVLEDDSPAVAAYVSTGVMAMRTGEDGSFMIDCEPWAEARIDPAAATRLTAVLPGWSPVTLRLPSLDEARKSGWPEPLVLRLTNRALSLRGRVVDLDGAPVAGLDVEPIGLEDFGLVTRPGIPAFSGVPMTVEQLAGVPRDQTDEAGEFELTGLCQRPYRLRLLSPESLLSVESQLLSEQDLAEDPSKSRRVEITFDTTGSGLMAGRVVDRRGVGLDAVRVSVSTRSTDGLAIGRTATTDADGRFRLEDVTTTPDFLRIEGAAIVPELFRTLDPGADVENLELVIGRRCRVRFDWGSEPRAEEELRVFDAQGLELMMMRLSGMSIGEVPVVAAQEGLTDVLIVSEAAAWAVVSRAGVELARIPLDLSLDGVQRVLL